MARILIVDGDPASRESLERALGDEGLDVAGAADAEAAWEAFSAFEPQVAILGRRLPRTDVEELIIRMRRGAPEIEFVSPVEPFAEMARRHNDANVLCMGGRILSEDEAWAITEVWLATPFEGGRHERRVERIELDEGGS